MNEIHIKVQILNCTWNVHLFSHQKQIRLSIWIWHSNSLHVKVHSNNDHSWSSLPQKLHSSLTNCLEPCLRLTVKHCKTHTYYSDFEMLHMWHTAHIRFYFLEKKLTSFLRLDNSYGTVSIPVKFKRSHRSPTISVTWYGNLPSWKTQ